MCLTIPAQIIKLKGFNAVIQDRSIVREINISLIPNLKVGDWILYLSDLAIKKISYSDAIQIKELLEVSRPVNTLKLSSNFINIIKASKIRDLTEEEIIYLLNIKGSEKRALFSEANLVRQTYLKDFICIHGIIEFSNYCRNDCLYCGLRKENQNLKHYRMTSGEIVETAEEAVNKKGYKLLVLQSGEDYFYTTDMLCRIIKKIKERCRVFIFVSIGERGYQFYKKIKQAGASGVLFRFETSNPSLFKKFHSQGKNLENRFKHLEFIKKMGYFIATGSLIGLPGQTIKDLARDILTTKKWANMVSSGPYVLAVDTPLANSSSSVSNLKKIGLTLKMIAILRLLMKETKIPVVTALETLAGEKGRKEALSAGANSLMLNLTPAKYRPFYKIYDQKFFQKENLWEKYGLFKNEESYEMLDEIMQKELKSK